MRHLPPDRPRRARAPHAVHVEELGNVLCPPAAHTSEHIAAVAVRRHHDGAADEYLAGIRHGLKPGGDVDAITVDITVIFDDIAEVDADAQLERPVVKALLDGQRSINRLVDAREHGKKAVSRGFEGGPPWRAMVGFDQIVKNSAQLSIGGSSFSAISRL